jgi:transaldolase / glucose-6-phosphate isomerase
MANTGTGLHWKLPAPLLDAVFATSARWVADGNVERLWRRDASLWTGGDEARWLAWLDSPSAQRQHLDGLNALQADVRAGGFRDALLLGMGGSSLGPEVLETVFGSAPGYPRLQVLDSTDPAQVAACAARVDPAHSLYVVASKSGSTLEPNILLAAFLAQARAALGPVEAPRHFLAITDPGSKLEAAAKQDGFRHIFHGVAEIGGRYSVLSAFGLVPAALLGMDVAQLLDRAAAMASACWQPPASNPGVALGIVLGEAARAGRDKLTLVASPPLWDLGAWLEQLIAESTGKKGKAIIPVDGERLAKPSRYGGDRLFVYLRLPGEHDPAQDEAVAQLEQAGQPVVRVEIADRYAVGAEFFRWEIATAVAGAVLGIHPFDQPDVEASKVETRKLTDEIERTGALPAEEPFYADGDIRLFASAANRAAVRGSALDAILRAHLGRLGAGDYFAVLAYVAMTAPHRDLVQAMRHRVRDSRRVATCLGFGPRFLHSTGQAYKGGPASGVFLQITCDDAVDVPVPGTRYSFGMVKAAQARGDLAVLNERGRRALRVHLGKDVAAGLRRLDEAIGRALAS